jgi:hypothetical protein
MWREIGSQAARIEGNSLRLADALGGIIDLRVTRAEPMAEQFRAMRSPWGGLATGPANLTAWKMLLPGTRIVTSRIG